MLSARTALNPAVLVACLVAAHLQACSDDAETVSNARTQIAPSQLHADASVEDALDAAIEFNHEVHAAYRRVRAHIENDRFALMDAFIAARAREEMPTDIIYATRREIYVYIREAGDDRLIGRTQALLDRFAEILASPRTASLEKRYHNYIRDVDVVLAIMRESLSDDDERGAERAYYIAPGFNALVSTRVVILVTLEYSGAAIEDAYAGAIETNRHLVGEDTANQRGYLYDYVTSWERPPGMSAQQQYDADPVVVSIRQSLTDQQSALE